MGLNGLELMAMISTWFYRVLGDFVGFQWVLLNCYSKQHRVCIEFQWNELENGRPSSGLGHWNAAGSGRADWSSIKPFSVWLVFVFLFVSRRNFLTGRRPPPSPAMMVEKTKQKNKTKQNKRATKSNEINPKKKNSIPSDEPDPQDEWHFFFLKRQKMASFKKTIFGFFGCRPKRRMVFVLRRPLWIKKKQKKEEKRKTNPFANSITKRGKKNSVKTRKDVTDHRPISDEITLTLGEREVSFFLTISFRS